MYDELSKINFSNILDTSEIADANENYSKLENLITMSLNKNIPLKKM